MNDSINEKDKVFIK